jgi:hypothetical protein
MSAQSNRDTVQHLWDYYRHLTTLSAGAIAVVATFSKDFERPGLPVNIAVVGLASLAISTMTSTAMMWTYGVASRQLAAVNDVTGWAHAVPSRSLTIAQLFARFLPIAAPLSFVIGFVCLAAYAGIAWRLAA